MGILEEETFKRFGYYSWKLSKGSHKPVLIKCENCGKIQELRKRGGCKLCQDCSRRNRVGEKHWNWQGGKIKCVCETCGCNFYIKQNEIKQGRGRFCSHQCYGIWFKGKNNHNWQGGKSFEPYCEKFNFRFKEKIREKYNRRCYFCGKTEEENGERLCVHHIDDDKEQGCNGKYWFVIPLCKKCHDRLHAMENKKKREKRKKKKEKIYNKVLYLQESLL